MNHLKISIITVTCNSAETLAEAIASVAGQTYPKVEYLIVDGASTDGTLGVISNNLDAVTRWISEPDQGMYDAMNKGIAMASGDIIGFLNSDDCYAHDHVLEIVASEFENPAIECCYADLIYVDRNNTHRVLRYMKACDYHTGLFQKGWCPPHPTFFVRRDVYDRLGRFDLSYTIGNDVELMMRFLEQHRIQSIYIPRVLVKMRMGGESNRDIGNIFRQNMEILRAARNNHIRIQPITFLIMKLISRFRQYIFHPEP